MAKYRNKPFFYMTPIEFDNIELAKKWIDNKLKKEEQDKEDEKKIKKWRVVK